MSAERSVIDSSLVCLEVRCVNGQAFLFDCDSIEAQKIVNDYASGAPGFTVFVDHPMSRVTFRSEHVLMVEQLTKSTAKERLERSAEVQKQIEAQNAAMRLSVAGRPTILR